VLPPSNSQPSNKPSLQITKRKRRQSSRRRDRQVKPRTRRRPPKRDRMSQPTSSTSIPTQVNDANQPSSTTASSSYDSSVPSTDESVNHISKSPPSECLPLSIWSAQTTAANITLKLGSIKSTIKPTPVKAAVTIQRWHRHNHYTQNTVLLDSSLIYAAFQETNRSRPPVTQAHHDRRYERYEQAEYDLYKLHEAKQRFCSARRQRLYEVGRLCPERELRIETSPFGSLRLLFGSLPPLFRSLKPRPLDTG